VLSHARRFLLRRQKNYRSKEIPCDKNRCVTECPERFCFGLLESFDVKQLAALSAPRPVTMIAATPRMKAELKDLAAWYQLFASQHQPLR
jgi:hypothetical protein